MIAGEKKIREVKYIIYIVYVGIGIIILGVKSELNVSRLTLARGDARTGV